MMSLLPIRSFFCNVPLFITSIALYDGRIFSKLLFVNISMVIQYLITFIIITIRRRTRNKRRPREILPMFDVILVMKRDTL